MFRLSIGVYMCFCVLISIAIWKQVDGREGSSCSCYSFHDKPPTSRNVGKHHCNISGGGDLVSMETVEEWEFIKTQIQSRTINEWWIGLEMRDGNWTWLSNYSLVYEKWIRRKPDDNNEKFATIVKEFNGAQGLFNQTTEGDEKGRICEYHKTNCSKDKLRWCGSNTVSPSSPTANVTKGRNESGLGPRHPSGCAVIKKQYTPIVIPILVALAGLVVIVAINIIILKWKSTAQGSNKKRDQFESRSEQEDMDPAEGITIVIDPPESGIEDEENLPPREEGVGGEGTNDIDIDTSCGDTAKQGQPYYVNVQGNMQQNTLPVTDTNGYYASVSDINETDGQNDSFVVVRTYSIVRNDDDDGQTDDVNTANYATVSETLGTDRQTVVLVTTESGYASVDVIKNNSQEVPSGHQDEQDASTSAPQDACAQYAVINKQKKRSKKDKTNHDDNRNNTDDGHAPVEVIYANCQGAPLAEEQQDNTHRSLADSVPDTGAKAEYAVVNKSMKRRNRSVKEATQPSTPAEASYACVDVKYCQDGAPVQEQRGSQRKKNAEEHTAIGSVSTAQVEYAAVDKSKKRSKSVQNAAKSNQQPIMPEHVPSAGVKDEYAVVDKSKKRSKSVQNAAKPNQQPTTVWHVPSAGVTEEYDVVDKSKKRSKSVQNTARPNQQPTMVENVPSAGAKEEYAVVDKSKKRSKSVQNAAKPNKPTESSACVDAECSHDDAPVPRPRGSRKKKGHEQHTMAENDPNAGVKVDKNKKTNRSIKEVATANEAAEASYASVDVIYDNC